MHQVGLIKMYLPVGHTPALPEHNKKAREEGEGVEGLHPVVGVGRRWRGQPVSPDQ